jgi:hypothetical protein
MSAPLWETSGTTVGYEFLAAAAQHITEASRIFSLLRGKTNPKKG